MCHIISLVHILIVSVIGAAIEPSFTVTVKATTADYHNVSDGVRQVT